MGNYSIFGPESGLFVADKVFDYHVANTMSSSIEREGARAEYGQYQQYAAILRGLEAIKMPNVRQIMLEED